MVSRNIARLVTRLSVPNRVAGLIEREAPKTVNKAVMVPRVGFEPTRRLHGSGF